MHEIKLRPGEEFWYNNIRFICLDIIDGNYLAITAECWCEKHFKEKYEDGCNNWEKSTLRRFLNDDAHHSRGLAPVCLFNSDNLILRRRTELLDGNRKKEE